MNFGQDENTHGSFPGGGATISYVDPVEAAAQKPNGVGRNIRGDSGGVTGD